MVEQACQTEHKLEVKVTGKVENQVRRNLVALREYNRSAGLTIAV